MPSPPPPPAESHPASVAGSKAPPVLATKPPKLRSKSLPEELLVEARKAKVERQRFEPAAVELSAEESAAFRLRHRWRMPCVIRRRLSPWVLSLVIHAAALVAMGLWITEMQFGQPAAELKLIAVSASDAESPDEQLDVGLATLSASPAKSQFEPSASDAATESLEIPLTTPTEAFAATRHTAEVDLTKQALATSPAAANWGKVLAGGGGLSGRSPEARARLASEGGGTRQSEEAVERGLNWLAAHQRDDGSWRFHFDGLPCNNTCRDAGTESSSTGATALALLPFYGAGYTHVEGRHAETVRRGLYFLCNRILVTPHGGDLQEGTMYAQGLATIVLCEAYAMTKDEKLRPHAEQAVKFVIYAQDTHGGGWRYSPGMPGDTTMTGWQLMALKSALMAGLEVPSSRFFLASRFLDSVQSERGAAYGYLSTVKRPTTSAVGLLSRMYLGWNRMHPAVRDGVVFFNRIGPSANDMYMNYYATQLMFHCGGGPWERWNKKMRDYLIQTQATEGHESGSWHFRDQHGDAGGRLYSTAMAILTLEVYYRYLPLYSDRAVDQGF